MLSDGLKLTGLPLAMLGHETHPDDLPDDVRAQFEAEDLDEMAAMPEGERAVSLRQARLLAGLLWHSSVVMIDQLYADLATVSEMKEITAAEIDGTWGPVIAAGPVRLRLRRRFRAPVHRCRRGSHGHPRTRLSVPGMRRGGAGPSGACLTRPKSLPTRMNSTWRMAGGNGLKTSCLKTRTATCCIRAGWTASKTTTT